MSRIYKCTWDEAKIKIAIKYFRQGLNLRQVGEKFGVSKQAIEQQIKKHKSMHKAFTETKLNKPTPHGLIQREKSYLRRFFMTYDDYNNLSKTEQKLLKKRIFMWQRKKYWADRHSVPFNLKFNDIVWPDKCPVLGFKLNYFSDKSSQHDRASFDRLDSTKGYVKGNVVIISFRANHLKSDGTVEEIEKILNYVKTFKQLRKLKKDYSKKSLVNKRAIKEKFVETFKYNRKYYTIAELYKMLKPEVSLNTFISRIRKQKWTIEDAIATPKNVVKSLARNGVRTKK